MAIPLVSSFGRYCYDPVWLDITAAYGPWDALDIVSSSVRFYTAVSMHEVFDWTFRDTHVVY